MYIIYNHVENVVKWMKYRCINKTLQNYKLQITISENKELKNNYIIYNIYIIYYIIKILFKKLHGVCTKVKMAYCNL